MPDWAVTVVVAAIAALPGLAAWYKAVTERKQTRAERRSNEKAMLQTVADTASATALRCLEAATKEMRMELDDTRAQLAALRARLADNERQLAAMRQQLEDAQAVNARSEARLEAQIRELEAERAALLLRIEELEGKA